MSRPSHREQAEISALSSGEARRAREAAVRMDNATMRGVLEDVAEFLAVEALKASSGTAERARGLSAAISCALSGEAVEDPRDATIREALDAWRTMRQTPFADATNSTAPWVRAYTRAEKLLDALAALRSAGVEPTPEGQEGKASR